MRICNYKEVDGSGKIQLFNDLYTTYYNYSNYSNREILQLFVDTSGNHYDVSACFSFTRMNQSEKNHLATKIGRAVDPFGVFPFVFNFFTFPPTIS